MKEVSIGGSETRLWRKQGEGAMQPDYGDGREEMQMRQWNQFMKDTGRGGSVTRLWRWQGEEAVRLDFGGIRDM